MDQHNFNLPIGTPIKLEARIANPTRVYQATVIGYVPGQSVLITLPYAEGVPFSPLEADEYVVRYAEGDNGYAFNSKVLRLCTDPYPYIHLEYPRGVQGVVTRTAQRVPVNVPVILLSAGDETRKSSVAMVDLSLSGARLVAYDRLGHVGDRFSIEMRVPTGDENDRVSFPVAVRYVREQAIQNSHKTRRYHHGVKFLTLNHNAELFLHRFVNDQIVQNRNQL